MSVLQGIISVEGFWARKCQDRPGAALNILQVGVFY